MVDYLRTNRGDGVEGREWGDGGELRGPDLLTTPLHLSVQTRESKGPALDNSGQILSYDKDLRLVKI